MIFLGSASNYSAGHTLRHLLAFGGKSSSQKLCQALAERYGGELADVRLYHTGRSALAAAFQALLPNGGPVILPGLTCIAVVRAIKAAGCTPVFVDIEAETLQYNYEKLQKTIKGLYKKDNVCYNGIILSQNTLGIALDAQKLEKIANEYHFAIVEDLAHCAGRFYPDGREIGTIGAATALSFGKGKAIDTIEGGALILRRKAIEKQLGGLKKSDATATAGSLELTLPVAPTRKPRLASRLRDRWYPLFGAISRGLAHLHLEKFWLGLLLRLHWIERSADAELDLDTRLTHWQARLAIKQLQNLPRTPLREHYLVENRKQLLVELAQHGARLDEIWYDTPVSPARYANEVDFPADTCPETVRVAERIINLPTWYSERRLRPARKIIAQHFAAAKVAQKATRDEQATNESCPVSSSDADLAHEWHLAQQLFPEANFLQSPAWGRMNSLIGHKVIVEYNILDQTSGETSAAPRFWCQMIVKNAKRGRYLEVPGGPLLDWDHDETKQAVFAKIREIARREHCVFVRIRPQLRADAADQLKGLNLRKAPMHLHAEHTVIIDLERSEEDLLKSMRRQTRYEVRRAEKLGVQVEWGNSEELFREFHSVQAETAARHHFVPPDLKTLLAEREAFGDNARLYVAKAEDGQPIAYGLILIDGAEAEYFEAASTELNHKLPGAYALQWQVMRDLKVLGIQRYNLWGIAPAGQKQHRYAGVTTFKTGFGGDVVEFVAAQDLVVKKFRYLFNLAIETARKKHRHL